MTEEEIRRPKGRRGRRSSRQPVIADVTGGFLNDDPDDDGSAGVREPRRPKPKGPVSGAGMRPEPEPPYMAVLAEPEPPVAAVLTDPRY